MNLNRILILVFGVMTLGLYAQFSPCPIDTIDGKPYYLYTVEKGLGLYRVSKNFGVPQEKILEANPTLQASGLVFGATILIPIMVDEPVVEKKEVKKLTFRKIERVAKDTVMVLKEETLDGISQATDSLRIAMMLPLHANAVKRNATMDKFMDFYMGSLIAIYEAQKAGKYIELFTYDVEKTTESLSHVLSDSVWQDVDAVIGPAYTQQVQKVTAFTERDSIWTLVPFVSELPVKETHPYVFQFNPSSQTEADVFAQYLSNLQDTVNCVVIQPKEGESVPNSIQYIHASLQKYSIPTTKTTIRDILVDSMEMALVEDKENILIFNTEKYNNLQSVLPHLFRLVGKYQITLYSRYSWQNEKILLPQIYTSVFQESLDSLDTYEDIYNEYFDVAPSSQYPRYDLLGYDLTKHFLHLLAQKDTAVIHESWSGAQSVIQYLPSAKHRGFENQKIVVIRK
jgi:hypothetical protein